MLPKSHALANRITRISYNFMFKQHIQCMYNTVARSRSLYLVGYPVTIKRFQPQRSYCRLMVMYVDFPDRF